MSTAPWSLILGVAISWVFVISYKGFSLLKTSLEGDIRGFNALKGYDLSVNPTEILKAYIGLGISSEVEDYSSKHELETGEYIQQIREELGIANLYTAFLVIHITTVIWVVLGVLQRLNLISMNVRIYLLVMFIFMIADGVMFTLLWSRN